MLNFWAVFKCWLRIPYKSRTRYENKNMSERDVWCIKRMISPYILKNAEKTLIRYKRSFFRAVKVKTEIKQKEEEKKL